MAQGDPTWQRFRRIPADLGRRFGWEVLLFAAAVVVVLGTGVAGLGFVNAARGYAIGTQSWIFHSARAVAALRMVDATGDARHLDDATRALRFPVAAGRAKEEMRRPLMDVAQTRQWLHEAGVDDLDVTPMLVSVWLFKHTEAVAEVMRRWDEGDREIAAIEALRQRAAAGGCGAHACAADLDGLELGLARAERNWTFAVARATRAAFELCLWSILCSGLALAVVGTLLIRFAVQRSQAQHAVEAALLAERAHAEATEKMRQRMLSQLGHELSTPLNAVLGFAQLLQHDLRAAGPMPEKMLAHIVEGGRHLQGLIGNVTQLLVAGQSAPAPLAAEPVAVRDVVLSAQALVEADRRAMEVAFDDDVDAALAVQADRQALMQILINLFSNGCKYNRRAGTVRVQARRVDERVVVEVTDEGDGVPAADRRRLFEPFTRLESHAGIKGTGLGLAISRSLARRMHGELEVDAGAHGRGTTFRLRLPAALATARAAA